MLRNENLPVRGREMETKKINSGLFGLYNKYTKLSKDGSYLTLTAEGQSYKFLIKKRRRASGLKTSEYLIQLEPFKEYISSLYKVKKGYLFEYKEKIFLLEIQEKQAFISYLKAGDSWAVKRLAKRWEK